MRAFLTIGKRVGQLIGLALAALSLLSLLALGIGPRFGGYRTMTVLTGSMKPHMPPGSVVVETPIPLRSVRVGDVITYQIPVLDHHVVTHRVIEVLRGGDQPIVRTQGDANAQPDEWAAQLQGGRAWKARIAVPRLGYALEALRDPRLRRLSLFAVPIMLAALWLADIWDRDEDEGTEDAPAPAPPVRPVTVALVLAVGAAVTVGRGRPLVGGGVA